MFYFNFNSIFYELFKNLSFATTQTNFERSKALKVYFRLRYRTILPNEIEFKMFSNKFFFIPKKKKKSINMRNTSSLNRIFYLYVFNEKAKREVMRENTLKSSFFFWLHASGDFEEISTQNPFKSHLCKKWKKEVNVNTL